MGVNEILYDILEYITNQKCHGEIIAAAICERLNGLDSDYELTLKTQYSDNFIFTERYTIKYYELRHLDTIRKKVDDILNDFRDKYEKMVLKANDETDSLYPRLLTIPEYVKADKELTELIESRVKKKRENL